MFIPIILIIFMGTVTGAVIDDTVPAVHKVVDKAVHVGQ